MTAATRADADVLCAVQSHFEARGFTEPQARATTEGLYWHSVRQAIESGDVRASEGQTIGQAAHRFAIAELETSLELVDASDQA